MAIEEAVINIRLVLENLKATKDLNTALVKVREDVTQAEKAFTKLKRGFMQGGVASKKAAKEAEELANTIAGMGREVLNWTGQTSVLTEGMMEMTTAMVNANKAIEEMARQRKLNIDASMAEKASVDKLGAALKEEMKQVADLTRAKRNLMDAEKAIQEINQDSTLTQVEKEEAIRDLSKGAEEREGVTATTSILTTEINPETGKLKRQDLTEDEDFRKKNLAKVNAELADANINLARSARQVIDAEKDQLRIEQALETIFKKRDKTTFLDDEGSITDADRDLKNYAGTLESVEDALKTGTLAELKMFRYMMGDTSSVTKKLDEQISKLEKTSDKYASTLSKGAAAEEKIKKAQEGRARLKLKPEQEQKAAEKDRRDAIEEIKKQIKAEQDLVAEKRKYYNIANKNQPLEIQAQKELNDEILREKQLELRKQAAQTGLERRNKLTEEYRSKLADINRLEREGLFSSEEANRLRAKTNKEKNQKLGFGNTFKANLDDEAKNAARALREVGQGMQDAGRQAIMFGAALSSALVPSIKAFADFNQEVTNVVAVMGDLSNTEAANTIESLSERFLELGERTEFTADQIAAAAKSLALAGFSVDEVKESIEAVTNLASAGNVPLEQAAGYFANITRAFDVDTSNAQRVADVLAVVATNSNTTIETLGESFKFIAPIASATGQSLEQVSTALGVLGNAGISASRAGTGLSRAFSELLEKEDDFSEILNSIGSSYDRIDPTRRTVTEIVNELERLKSAGLLDTAGFFEMFDQRSARAVLTLVNQGSDAMQELGEKTAESAGKAAKISEQRLDTLSGDLLKLQSASDSARISLGQVFGEFTRDVLQNVTVVIKEFRTFVKENPNLVKTAAFLGSIAASMALVGGSASLVAGGLVRVVAGLQNMGTVLSALITTFKSLGGVAGTAFTAMRTGGLGAAGAFRAAAVAAWPLVAANFALIASIAALGVALLAVYAAMASSNQTLEEAFSQKYKDRVESITKATDNLSTSLREVSNSLDLIRKLPDLNLTQLRDLTSGEGIFTFDLNRATSEIDKIANQSMANLQDMTSQQLDTRTTVNTQRLLAAAADFRDAVGTIFSGEVLKGLARTTSFAFTDKVTELSLKKNELGINEIIMKRTDDFGLLREKVLDITTLTGEQKKQAITLLALEKQREKVAELMVQKENMLKAFRNGRIGFEQFKTSELEKQEKLQEEIAKKETEINAANSLGEFDKAKQIEAQVKILRDREKAAKANVDMANKMLKSTEKELAASSAFVAQQERVGAQKREINRRAESLARIQKQIAETIKEGNEPTEQQKTILEEQIHLRDQALDQIKSEIELEQQLAEKLNQVMLNERARVDLIQEALKLRKEAADQQKKLDQELEESKPVRMGKDGLPEFMSDKEMRELQTKRAKEAQVGTISPEDLIKKIETKTNSSMGDNTKEFLEEIEKAMAGESEFGTLGTFGQVELAERMERERIKGLSSVDGLKAQEDEIKKIQADILANKELTNREYKKSDGDIEVFLRKRQEAEENILKGEIELVKKRQGLAESRKVAAEGTIANDKRIQDAEQKRLDQSRKLDELKKNQDDKERTEELRKEAEERKKQKEKEEKERKKDNDKRKKAIEDAKFEDKKRQLKMAKLKKDKNLEEKLTKEVAEITRQRAADSKFGTDEELKKLKADKTLNAEQQKVVKETIARKQQFLKDEKKLFEEEQKQKKAEKKDQQIEDLNKKAIKQEEKRLTTQEKIRDAMLKQAKTLKDFVLITKFLNRQEAIRKMAQSRAREKAVGTGSSLDTALSDPKKSIKQKQKLFSKAAERLRKAKEMGVTGLELTNLEEALKRNKDIMTTMASPGNSVKNPVNQNGQGSVQGGVVNNVENPNIYFNLAGIKDPDEFMQMIGENAKKITEALFTQGGQQRAKNQGKMKPPKSTAGGI